jgi:hypothetical protein
MVITKTLCKYNTSVFKLYLYKHFGWYVLKRSRIDLPRVIDLLRKAIPVLI